MKGLLRILIVAALARCLLPGVVALTVHAQDGGVAGQAASGAPAEIAQLPYQALVGIARGNSERPAEGERMLLRISSSEGVEVSKIKLTIHRKDGQVAIQIDEKGDLEVPYSVELYDENPMVVSNQPKGTMDLKVLFDIKEARPKVVDGKVRYQDLFLQLLELQKAMKDRDPSFGTPGHQTLAIQIITGGEPVSIVRKLGSRTIKPDEEGNVWMVYDLLLFEENPEVAIPEKAEVNIQPVDPRTAISIRAQ